MSSLQHVFIPCKMNSRRIPRKNLQTIGGQSLLELAIERFRRWHPEAVIHVASEDDAAAGLAMQHGCRVYPLSDADVNDRRTVSELFQEWLSERRPQERCCLTHVTCPFFFRSELQAALADPRPFVTAAWTGKLYVQPPPGELCVLTQQLPISVLLSGCFHVTWGQHQIAADDWTRSIVPVSWLGLIDIDEPEDLHLADVIAGRMGLEAFEK